MHPFPAEIQSGVGDVETKGRTELDTEETCSTQLVNDPVVDGFHFGARGKYRDRADRTPCRHLSLHTRNIHYG